MITKQWLKEKETCQEAIDYFVKQDKKEDAIWWVNHLIEAGKLDWANWFIVRVMAEY